MIERVQTVVAVECLCPPFTNLDSFPHFSGEGIRVSIDDFGFFPVNKMVLLGNMVCYMFMFNTP